LKEADPNLTLNRNRTLNRNDAVEKPRINTKAHECTEAGAAQSLQPGTPLSAVLAMAQNPRALPSLLVFIGVHSWFKRMVPA
jgi:hypothetical protein